MCHPPGTANSLPLLLAGPHTHPFNRSLQQVPPAEANGQTAVEIAFPQRHQE